MSVLCRDCICKCVFFFFCQTPLLERTTISDINFFALLYYGFFFHSISFKYHAISYADCFSLEWRAEGDVTLDDLCKRGLLRHWRSFTDFFVTSQPLLSNDTERNSALIYREFKYVYIYISAFKHEDCIPPFQFLNIAITVMPHGTHTWEVTLKLALELSTYPINYDFMLIFLAQLLLAVEQWSCLNRSVLYASFEVVRVHSPGRIRPRLNNSKLILIKRRGGGIGRWGVQFFNFYFQNHETLRTVFLVMIMTIIHHTSPHNADILLFSFQCEIFKKK